MFYAPTMRRKRGRNSRGYDLMRAQARERFPPGTTLLSAKPEHARATTPYLEAMLLFELSAHRGLGAAEEIEQSLAYITRVQDELMVRRIKGRSGAWWQGAGTPHSDLNSGSPPSRSKRT
jgi:hypothetical protein